MDIHLVGLEDLQRKILKAAKFSGSKDIKVQNIHKRITRNAARRLKRLIYPFEEDIKVYDKGNRKRGKPPRVREVIKKGTYKRSIGTWQPKDGGKFNHVYYVGARTGKKVAQRNNAWFQLIVEQDAQFIKGNNRHVGVLEGFVKSNKPKMFKQLLQAYKEDFPKRFK